MCLASTQHLLIRKTVGWKQMGSPHNIERSCTYTVVYALRGYPSCPKHSTLFLRHRIWFARSQVKVQPNNKKVDLHFQFYSRPLCGRACISDLQWFGLYLHHNHLFPPKVLQYVVPYQHHVPDTLAVYQKKSIEWSDQFEHTLFAPTPCVVPTKELRIVHCTPYTI